MTDKEIKELCEPANNKIKELSSSLKNALEFYRVKVNRDNKFEPFDKNNWFEKGLSLYPELIKDPATQQDLKDKKNSLVKRYRAGKLDVRGKFTFVLPDLYAFCEWLFLGIEKPEGLIEDGEVYCKLYPTVKELDCLRSPHLSCEHSVRQNIYGKKRRGINLDEWFGKTDAIYISTKDLISRILQLDVDGDKLLVLADDFIVNIAKRNSKEIYPLYYEMKKAKSELITPENLYTGLELAFKGGKIGGISNDITKIWAEDKITNDEMSCIKWLCMETNFTIDYAKTLFKPERPKQVNKLIKTYTHKKVPYFFRYAKDKIFSKNYKKSQTEKCGNGVIDRITKTIKDKRIIFSNIKNLNDIDYRYMLSDFNHDYVDERINKLFNHHNRYYGYNIRYDDKDKDDNNINYICQVIRSELNEIEPDDNKIVDSLITMMYKKPSTKKKNLLWILYGEIICNNLEKNIGNSNICIQCGRRVDYNLTLGKCKSCRPDANRRQLENKEIICSDCGKRILIPSSSRRIRCDSCMAERRKETYKKSKQNKNSTSYST